MAKSFKVGLVQMAMSPRPEENLDRAAAAVAEAARRGAEVVCLPELFRTPYFCQREDQALFDLAEPVPGPSTERLGRAARVARWARAAPVSERAAPAPAKHGGGGVMRCYRDADGEAVVEVLDEGPGVAADQLDKLAAPFFRADDARSQANGAGLGLAIAQAIAEAHGGRLVLANRTPRGFSAKLILPG